MKILSLIGLNLAQVTQKMNEQKVTTQTIPSKYTKMNEADKAATVKYICANSGFSYTENNQYDNQNLKNWFQIETKFDAKCSVMPFVF